MVDQPVTAGPSLAAHSKDASTPGPAPASSAMGPATSSASQATREMRDTASEQAGQVTDQLGEYVRQQPMTALAITAGLFLVLGWLLGRR